MLWIERRVVECPKRALADRVCGLAGSVLVQASRSCPSSPATPARTHLRETLLPNGLTITQKSLREESGQAKMLQQRLTSNDRAYLKKLPVLNGKLAYVVDEWISVGVELGALEDQKAAEEAKQSQLVSGAETVAARNKWIRSIKALGSMLELAEASDDTMAKILGPLRETEEKADRLGNRKEPAPVTSEPAPVPEKPERDE